MAADVLAELERLGSLPERYLILEMSAELRERQRETLAARAPRLLERAPGGRALFIVPNRGGLWARRDATPFGFGRPYTLSQLEAQLRAHDFLPERDVAALFQPPTSKRFSASKAASSSRSL